MTSEVKPTGRNTIKVIFGVGMLLIVVGAAYYIGYKSRARVTAELNTEAEKRRDDPPTVNTAKVKRAPLESKLLLPGTVTPITEAYVFARAAGYLSKRYVDIGDQVQSGQLLAEVDAPDLDQQVTQAQAGVGTGRGPTWTSASFLAAAYGEP